MMLSAPQLTDIVRAAPMPLHVKEQILDAALGYHDDLYKTDRLGKPGKPMKTEKTERKTPTRTERVAATRAERVAAMRDIGGFDFLRSLPNGDAVHLYCKSGATAYELVVRDGQPVHCTCPNFRFEVYADPSYCCKHMDYWVQQEAADAVIAACADAAAAWETAWAHRELGRLTDAEAGAAYARLEAARDAMRKVVMPSAHKPISFKGSF